jgi:V/A-type H+-transporting ATPase subunit I
LPQAEAEVARIAERAGELLNRRQQLLEQLTKLTTECELVSGYRGVGLPLDHDDQNSFLHFITGTLPEQNFEVLQDLVADDVALLPLPASTGRQPLIALTTQPGQAALETVLTNAGFEHEKLPAVRGATVDSLLDSKQLQLAQLPVALRQVNAELDALAEQSGQPLVQIAALARLEQSFLEVGGNFPRTEATILIGGWVPTADSSNLIAHVKQITAGRCAVQLSAPERFAEEQPPVLLRNPWFLRPFQSLVAAYGLPQYQELEPTLFFAISYLVMFGMMFGDAGHGAVLMFAGLITGLTAARETLRHAGLLLLLGGMSSLAFGLLYGSCFGLAAIKKYAMWHDPLEGDPVQLIHAAIGFGIVLISLGLILNVINRFRRGEILGTVFHKFGILGLLFYWGALLLILRRAELKSAGLFPTALIVFLVLPLLGWVLKAPIEYLLHRRAIRLPEPVSGPAPAFAESLVGAFEGVLTYLANTISFVRLAAYAMSHAALLVAAFMLADAVRHFPAGVIFSLLLIVLGNVAVIALEAVIASVQALRLEYYEFFGKFFSGAGQAFKPFRLVPDAQLSN